MKPIPFLSLTYQHQQIRAEALNAITNVYDSNWFILGKELESFEEAFALFTKTSFCVGVGNGFDALFIALKACGVGPGDEVIVPAHTFIATWLAVTKTGAKIIPLEPDPGTFTIAVQNLGNVFTKKTKAVVPVHLYGQSCDMTGIMTFAKDNGIFVIEDNAQAQGATWKGKPTGSFGDINATSFYPVKNLGALGDGGALTTNNQEFAAYARKYRNYGFEVKSISDAQGINSRLDEIQAAVLRLKLKYLQTWNAKRIQLASTFLKGLNGIGDIQLPVSDSQALHVYHLFVIRTGKRDELRTYLSAHQIETMIHYPIPPHLQKSYQELSFGKGHFPITETIANTALSLPLWPGMEESEVAYVCDVVKRFFS